MGYTTEFDGEFRVDRPVDEETYTLLKGLSETRRMARDVGPEYGVEGEFYVDGGGHMGQDDEPNVINRNRPPSTQPSLWCDWTIMEDRQTIVWDGMEKFYRYVDWIKYLIGHVLEPRGYSVSGDVRWQGEDFRDFGKISIRDNDVTLVFDELPEGMMPPEASADELAEARMHWEQATWIREEIARMRERADYLHAMLATAGDDALRGLDPSLVSEWNEWQELLGAIAGYEATYDALTPEGMDDTLREWYVETYPDDEFGGRIREGVTFADLHDTVACGRSFSSLLGTYDTLWSPISGRCLGRLAAMWGVTYDNAYCSWIDRI